MSLESETSGKNSWFVHVCDWRKVLHISCVPASLNALCDCEEANIPHFSKTRYLLHVSTSVHQYHFASKEIISTFQRSGDSDTRIGHSHKVVATWRHACGEVHIPENSNVCLKILFYLLYFRNKFSKIECMFSSQEFQIFNQSSKYIHECYPLMRKLLSGLGDGVHSGHFC